MQDYYVIGCGLVVAVTAIWQSPGRRLHCYQCFCMGVLIGSVIMRMTIKQ